MHKTGAALFIAFICSPMAMALDKEPFSGERFAELQAAGALVLIDVYADWCSTCAKQQEILKRYLADHPEVDLNILEVDFDADRDHVRRLRAPRQSTLLLYRGEDQFWYSVAETRPEVIYEAINRAVEFEYPQ